jgi:hypothetical protein
MSKPPPTVMQVLKGRCCDHAESMSYEIDGRLSWPARLLLRIHRLTCIGCRAYYRSLLAIRAAARAIGGRGDVPGAQAGMPEDAKARIAAKLREPR